MNYYVVENNYSEVPKMFKKYKYDTKLSKLIYKGASIEGFDSIEDKKIQFVLEKKTSIWPDFDSFALPMVSSRAKNILDTYVHSVAIHYFDVDIYLLSQKLDVQYYAFSVPVIAGMDREKSEFETFEGTDVVSSIKRLVINSDIVQEAEIFRLKEDRASIFVNEHFRNRVLEHELIGFKFIPLENFTSGVI